MEELRIIANRLLELSGESGEPLVPDRRAADAPRDRRQIRLPAELTDEGVVAAARAIAQMRRRRQRHFPASLLGEPAWDMLLELTICAGKRARVTTMALCAVAGVPPSTALRTVRLLEDEGLLKRTRAPDDKRLSLLAITPEGFRRVKAYVTELMQREDTRLAWF